MKKPKILIVEDEYILALDLEKQLQNLGYDVAGHASSGEDAIRKAEKHSPDLVLMDIKIQGPIDGIEAAKVITRRFDIPVVYLTAYSGADILKRAKITKPFGYLIKPVKKQELAANIEMALDKHALERTIRKNEAWYLSMLSSIGDGVVAADTEGNVQFMNSVAGRLLGVGLAEMKGRPIGRFFQIRDAFTGTVYEPPLSRLAADSNPFELPAQSELAGPGGTFTPIGGNAAPIVDLDGHMVGVVLTFRDLTAYRDLEQRLRNLERFRIFSQIASGVAHEVRNPLNAIQAVTAAMAQELESNQDVKTYFEHIQVQVKRLSVLMKDLLELGRPIQPSSLKRESISEICEDAVLMWRQSSETDAEVDFQLSPAGAGCMVMANADRMHQVVINLLENAVQNGPPGGRIALSVEPANSAVRICVTDAGTGVPEGELGRVFEPFFTMNKDGVGLGLSIVKSIVEQHQGRIVLKNNDPPPGCTVEIEFPLVEGRS